MASKILRVGFDLDGVLLYNPARIARPLVVMIKRLFFKIEKTQFYVPKSPLEQLIWRLFHYSSLFTAAGLEDIKELTKKGKIEAYIVTGRYGFLRPDFENWLRKIDATQYFKKSLINKYDEQPHLFKKRIIEELKLDVFVEDNWDIVKKIQLNSGGAKKIKILWIYNILDRKISYDHKFSSLKKAVSYIGDLANS